MKVIMKQKRVDNTAEMRTKFQDAIILITIPTKTISGYFDSIFILKCKATLISYRNML